ncbi:hypothetical protein [Xenorhabdus taiwanensis]|uniref:Uncharacterized protein n=1 Tax=Xenorhabdus taiwanensis TaxID=3085177 RepID=A0ABN7C7A9_9GAMM|nr:hypothetical protein TCT1_31360 [Xenorhabdus sp. TCT-1]
MALPKRYYYRIESLINSNKDLSVENFIHYAATNRLELCVKINDITTIEDFCVSIHPSFQELINNRKTPAAMARYQNNFGYVKAMVEKPVDDLIVNSNSNISLLDICYTFAIIDESISKNEIPLIKGNKINVKTLNLPREIRMIDFGESITPMVITMKDDFFIDTSDLIVTDIELEKLNNGGEIIKKENNEILPKIHPTTERHSKNKLEVISAAFCFKEEDSELFNEKCRHKDGRYNFSAWAKQIKKREVRLFPDCKAPVSDEKMAEYISKALKLPHS